jgi:hypothetical protein
MSNSAVCITVDELVHRIRAEFLEMPGLKLTRSQAKRLWDLDDQLCTEVLDLLAETKFLQRTSNGTYARLFGGASGS